MRNAIPRSRGQRHHHTVNVAPRAGTSFIHAMKTILFIFALIFAAIFAQACKEEPKRTWTQAELDMSFAGQEPSGCFSGIGN